MRSKYYMKNDEKYVRSIWKFQQDFSIMEGCFIVAVDYKEKLYLL